jgi:hypothetical protein
VVWPTLVAILSSPDAGASPVRRVVLEDRTELIQIRSAGETLGDIVVTEISADDATLTHTPTGESVRVPLR